MSPIVSSTVLHLNFLPSISSFFTVLSVFLFYFSFFWVSRVILFQLVDAFPWTMNNFLSVKTYDSAGYVVFKTCPVIFAETDESASWC